MMFRDRWVSLWLCCPACERHHLRFWNCRCGEFCRRHGWADEGRVCNCHARRVDRARYDSRLMQAACIASLLLSIGMPWAREHYQWAAVGFLVMSFLRHVTAPDP